MAIFLSLVFLGCIVNAYFLAKNDFKHDLDLDRGVRVTTSKLRNYLLWFCIFRCSYYYWVPMVPWPWSFGPRPLGIGPLALGAALGLPVSVLGFRLLCLSWPLGR